VSSEVSDLLEMAKGLHASWDALYETGRARPPAAPESRTGRIELDPEDVGRGLAQLVLTIVELLRQLMERQAIRRMEGGSLDDEQVERLGTTFMKLEARMRDLREHFGLTEADLNIDLGPLGRLL
jgi:hypothetical protein